ncbi:hypothetical protein CAPTEDRAFT_205638, partial [Capitella teleta]
MKSQPHQRFNKRDRGEFAENELNKYSLITQQTLRGLDTNTGDKEKSISVVVNKVEISYGTPSIKQFILDASLGRDLFITFDFQDNAIELEVSSPSGETFNRRSKKFWCNDDFRTCRFLKAEAEAGVWIFELATNDQRQTVSYVVEAKSADPSTVPIMAATEWKSPDNPRETQKVYTSVRQGSSPVLHVSVSAKISRPNATDLTIQLKDDGLGADSFANDGIYSADFVALTGGGRYSLQVGIKSVLIIVDAHNVATSKTTVEGDESTATDTEAIIGMGGSEGNKSGLRPTGQFQRSALGQSIQVTPNTPAAIEPSTSTPVVVPADIPDVWVTDRIDLHDLARRQKEQFRDAYVEASQETDESPYIVQGSLIFTIAEPSRNAGRYLRLLLTQQFRQLVIDRCHAEEEGERLQAIRLAERIFREYRSKQKETYRENEPSRAKCLPPGTFVSVRILNPKKESKPYDEINPLPPLKNQTTFDYVSSKAKPIPVVEESYLPTRIPRGPKRPSNDQPNLTTPSVPVPAVSAALAPSIVFPSDDWSSCFDLKRVGFRFIIFCGILEETWWAVKRKLWWVDDEVARDNPDDQDDPDGHDYYDGSDDTDGHTYREDHDDVDDRDDPNGYDDHDDHDNPDDQDVPDDHDDHGDHDYPDDQDVPDDNDDPDDPDGHTDRNDHDDSRDDSLDKEPGCAKILLIQLMSFECSLCVLLKGSNTPYSPYSHPTHQHIPTPQYTNTTILEYIHITRISIAHNRQSTNTERSEGQRAISEYWRQKFVENKEPESKRIHHCQIATTWKAPIYCIFPIRNTGCPTSIVLVYCTPTSSHLYTLSLSHVLTHLVRKIYKDHFLGTFFILSTSEYFIEGPGGKNYPPNRIKDLIVTEYDQELFTVTLEWTAVGEQANVGTASEYELRYGLNGADIRKDFQNLTLVSNEMIINGADLKDPRPSGHREVVKIKLPSAFNYYSFGIVAIDKKLRYSRSEISNIVGVSFKIHTTQTTTATSTFAQTTTESAQESHPKIVLVLDVSGSMNEDRKRIKLVQGCYSFVRFGLSECSEVGIVLFNETAIISHPLTLVPRDPTARQDIVNGLPKKAGGGTSIGAGIIKALDLLGGDAKGSHIIVAADGKETNTPYIADVTERVLISKVTVHSIAITGKADNEMNGLSKKTNGRTYLVEPTDEMSFFPVFKSIGNSIEDYCESTNHCVSNRRDLFIIIEYEYKEFEVKVSSPSGATFTKKTSEEFWCNDDYKTCQFLKTDAQSGMWTVELTTEVVHANDEYQNSAILVVGVISPPKKMVLVLDTSMHINDLRRICYSFLHSRAAECFEVGIVAFNETANIALGLTRVTDVSWEDLLHVLPTNISGGTSVGA